MGGRRGAVVVVVGGGEGRRFAAGGSRWLGWGAVGNRRGFERRVVVVVAADVAAAAGRNATHTRQPCPRQNRCFWRWMANLWVLMRRSIIMLTRLIMTTVRLLPCRPVLRWRIDVPLALWLLWRRSHRELLGLAVVGAVGRWWGVRVRLGVGREVGRSGVVVVGCHVAQIV